MGGGRQMFQSNVAATENDPLDTWSCNSQDGRDLIKDWKEDKLSRSVTHQIVYNNSDLQNLDTDTEFLLGNCQNEELT